MKSKKKIFKEHKNSLCVIDWINFETQWSTMQLLIKKQAKKGDLYELV